MTILWFWDLNLERCRKKLEREAKQATVGIFGGKSWSVDFCDWQGELPRRSEWGKRMMERGGSGRSRGFFYFFRDWASGERLMNFVLLGSKVCLFLEGRQCCDEVS
jgi:hypothetical protein